MYHVAEMVRDTRRALPSARTARLVASSGVPCHSSRPFRSYEGSVVRSPVALCVELPDLVKRAVGATCNYVVYMATHTHERTRVETTNLPAPWTPLQNHVEIPLLCGVEGLAHFVTSEELLELYFVAKNAMRRRFFLWHVALPPVGAAESVVGYVVSFASYIILPSRAEIEDRTDSFFDDHY
ncbi:hypothetical protein PsorP6_009927 [Peronosclerospora sorghi]|uniref:Uncharacterized protein n=1 Tax=Peronosclerospora sorghi TaxID=230839 RepID=A0ACC0VY66_9STRA|nr:hypothetical protein PsorP6_009927 [Peronosclerospora sorghi]